MPENGQSWSVYQLFLILLMEENALGCSSPESLDISQTFNQERILYFTKLSL